MRVRAQDPHGRHWVVTRRVVAWTPRFRMRSLMDDLPLRGTTVDAPPDVTSGIRTLTNAEAAQTRGLTYGSVMILIELPLLAVQAIVWIVLAVATLAYRSARRRAWTITAYSEYPTPTHFAEATVGWRRSRDRIHQLAVELRSGADPHTAA
jgi:hypothetical protein